MTRYAVHADHGRGRGTRTPRHRTDHMNTPPRAIRVPDELWNRAVQATALNGDTVTHVLHQALEHYLQEHPE